jgi:hypothetical protein
MHSSLALEPMDGADAETNLASHLHNAEPYRVSGFVLWRNAALCS